jgi:prophage antirepressor-like protein
MNAKNNSQAQTGNEQTEVMTFNFSESKSEIRNVFVNEKPHFIGSDIAKALGYKNTTKALKDHCRYVTKSYIPHPQSKTKQLQVLVIPEGDLYRLIINSTLPSAQKFESWVMDEVLPTIRKKGIYAMNSNRHNDDFIDARTIPFAKVLINEVLVRMIVIDEVEYYSINDYHNAINSRTGANQTAKKLNALEKLAVKIWLYGNTHPAWFTKIRGLELIASGSRIMKPSNQIMLPL